MTLEYMQKPSGDSVAIPKEVIMDSAPKQVDVVPIQTYMQGGWDLFKQQMGPIVCVCIGLTLIHMIIRLC